VLASVIQVEVHLPTCQPLAQAEQQFLLGAGTLVGAVKHLNGDEREQITIEAISTEAVTTSEIEGEIPDSPTVGITNRQPTSWAGGAGDCRDDGRSLPLIRGSTFQRNAACMAQDAG
jgi:hypothetical protein